MRGPNGPPPTIADILAQGVTGFSVTCSTADCLHSARLAFVDLGLPYDTPFPEIPARRNFVCAACGGRRVSVMPDWRDHRAAGMGRCGGFIGPPMKRVN